MTDIQNKPRAEEKEYLPKLVTQLEELIEQDINIPFNLKEIKNKGFSIKTRGLLAYISFYNIPWKYKDKKSWEAVFKSIKGKQFYGKVLRLIKDPLFITFQAQVPQFKTAKLVDYDTYRGLIFRKNERTLFIDIGYHFNWTCGSIVGLVHRSYFYLKSDFDTLMPGDEIEAVHFGIDKYGNKQLFPNREALDCHLQIHTGMIGQVVDAKVIEINKVID